MVSQSSQQFESYVPVYDAVPEKWGDARAFLVEQFKKISNAVNIREIGWLLDQELLNGQQFFPGVTANAGQQFRSVFRKVVDFSPLIAGINTKAHGIIFDANFSLMHLYAAATNAVAFTAEPIPNGADTIMMDATNIVITVVAPWTRCFAVCEYIQEL